MSKEGEETAAADGEIGEGAAEGEEGVEAGEEGGADVASASKKKVDTTNAAEKEDPIPSELVEEKQDLPDNYFVKSSATGDVDVDSSAPTKPSPQPTIEAKKPYSSSSTTTGRSKLSSRLSSSSASNSGDSSNSKKAGVKQELMEEQRALADQMKEILVLPVGMLVLPPFKKSECHE